MMLRPFVAAAALAFVPVAGALAADPPADPARLALTTDRVVVFKDGYALFAKTAIATADEQGRVYTEHVPDAAVLGCFWAASEDGRALMMRAEWVERKDGTTSERPCVSMTELLRVNAGRTLTLELNDGRARITGTIVEVLEHASEAPGAGPVPARPHRAEAYATSLLESLSTVVYSGGQYVVVDESQAGRIVLPVGSVHRIVGDLKTKTTDTSTVTTKSKRLTFELGASAAGKPAKIRLFHFQPGVRWIPTYRMTEIDPGPARLTLQAEILNEAEDIEGAALDLVVGFPNFRFKEVVSPLSLEGAMRNALQQAAPGLMSQQLANVQFRNRAGEWQGDRDAEGRTPEAPADIVASGEQDLFVYSLGAFSLKKGARAAVPVWEQQVDRRHLYTLDVPVTRDPRAGSESTKFEGSPNGSPLRKLPFQVWHQIELANAGKNPWTTGAILMLQGALPLAQELLTYTSMGGKALVPVTVAVDVRAEHGEEEIERRPNVLSWHSTTYSLVRKRGEVTVTNRRPEAIDLRVTLGMAGRVDEASDSGKVVINDHRPGDWGNDSGARLNNHSDVTWDLTLKPGETRTVKYTVQFYVY